MKTPFINNSIIVTMATDIYKTGRLISIKVSEGFEKKLTTKSTELNTKTISPKCRNTDDKYISILSILKYTFLRFSERPAFAVFALFSSSLNNLYAFERGWFGCFIDSTA